MKFWKRLKTLKNDQKGSFWDPKMPCLIVFGLFQNFIFQLVAPCPLVKIQFLEWQLYKQQKSRHSKNWMLSNDPLGLAQISHHFLWEVTEHFNVLFALFPRGPIRNQFGYQWSCILCVDYQTYRTRDGLNRHTSA